MSNYDLEDDGFDSFTRSDDEEFHAWATDDDYACEDIDIYEACERAWSTAKNNTHRDISIGFVTFKSGVKISTVFDAIDRHNKIYKDLIKITPENILNEIIARHN